MKKAKPRQTVLRLARETLRILQVHEIRDVVGGDPEDDGGEHKKPRTGVSGNSDAYCCA